jgi:hypothetical protein
VYRSTWVLLSISFCTSNTTNSNTNLTETISAISEIALFGINGLSNLGECSKLLSINISLSNDSYIESGVGKRIEQIAQILSQTKVISKISLPKEYSDVYPFTSMRYSGISSIEIRAK